MWKASFNFTKNFTSSEFTFKLTAHLPFIFFLENIALYIILQKAEIIILLIIYKDSSKLIVHYLQGRHIFDLKSISMISKVIVDLKIISNNLILKRQYRKHSLQQYESVLKLNK